MRYRLYYNFLLILYLIFFACKRELSFLYPETSKLVIDSFEPEQLRIKGKLIIKDQKKNTKAILDMRLILDSVIWISLRSGSNIEGFRMLIIPDSAIIINRINKFYNVYNYEKLSDKLHIDVNFYILQSIILGNLPWEIQSPKRSETETYFKTTFEKKECIIQYITEKKTRRLKILKIDNNLYKSQFSIDYQNFQSIEKYLFAHTLKVNSTYYQNRGMYNNLFLITYTKIDIEKKPLKVNFKIPSKYKKKL